MKKEKLIEKLQKKVRKYNEKAEQWHFIPIQVDETFQVHGDFMCNESTDFDGFFSELKWHYKYGYMKEDYFDIVEICNKLKYNY